MRTTRAQRMAMPLARQVVKDLAVEHGACIRPIQLRRTNLDTGEVDTVLVPCGHTLAHVCPSCAERARTPARCPVPGRLAPRGRTRPDPRPGHRGPAMVGRRCAPKPSSPATRPTRPGRTRPTSTSSSASWTRRSPSPACAGTSPRTSPPRRHRSTRRRQDAPDLPRRKVSPRTLGQDLHRAGRQDVPPVDVRHPDLPVLRPGRPPAACRSTRPGTTTTRPPGTR